MQEGGHSVPRTYMTPTESGADVLNPMLEKLSQMGLDVRTQFMLKRSCATVRWRVKGLQVRTGYAFQNGSGKVKTIQAKKRSFSRTEASVKMFRSAPCRIPS